MANKYFNLEEPNEIWCGRAPLGVSHAPGHGMLQAQAQKNLSASSFPPALPPSLHPSFLPSCPLPPLHCLSFLSFSLSPLGPFVITQLLSHVWLCHLSDCCMPGFPVLHYLPEFAQVHVHCISDAIQPSHPLSPPSPALNPSQHQGLFQWVSSSHQLAKYWSYSFSISPSDAYSGLISFRINWFDLLVVQGNPKSLLQHYSSKASILWHSAFFMVQLLMFQLLD